MIRIAVAAGAGLLMLLPAAATGAGSCQPGPRHPPLRATFEDLSLTKVLAGPPTVYAGHRVGIDGQFPEAGMQGYDGVIPGSVTITAPGALTTKNNGGHQIAVIPQAPGTIPVTFTWTETLDPTASNPVPSCDGSATVDMSVIESKPATIKLRTLKAAGKPQLDLRLALGFARNGDASPITMRARAVGGTTPPRSGLKRIATLTIDAVSKGLRRRIGPRVELSYSASASGGTAHIRWTGKRTTSTHGALSADLVQRGKVVARLRTGISCSRKSCRTVRLRLTKP
jgi:hypothetical protein